MEFGEFFVIAVKITIVVTIAYFAMPLISERFPSISRFGLMIILSVIAIIITFIFGYLMRGDTSY